MTDVVPCMSKSGTMAYTLRVGPLLVHLPGGELVLAERSLLWWLVLCILLIFLVSLLLPLQVAKCIEVGLPALVLFTEVM
jgi:hypothetical protein